MCFEPGCGLLAGSAALPLLLWGGTESSFLLVSKACVTSFPPPASLFPQSRLSNEHFRFIKGSFENIFSFVKIYYKKVGAHLDLVEQTQNKGWEKPSTSGAGGLTRLSLKYSYPFFDSSPQSEAPSHHCTSSSPCCSYPLRTPPGYVLVSVIRELGMKILLHSAGNIVPALLLTLGGIELRTTRKLSAKHGGKRGSWKRSESCGTGVAGVL